MSAVAMIMAVYKALVVLEVAGIIASACIIMLPWGERR